MTPMSGLFIVIEGPDGSGTTKHTELLAEKLENAGFDVCQTKEPTDGPIGTEIRQNLVEGKSIDPLELQRKFCQDRAWHLDTIIVPALQEGKIVVSDRYLQSTLAYGEALGLRMDILEDLNKNFVQQDLLFLLLPPLSVIKQRIEKREQTDELEEFSLQERVYQSYKDMAERNPNIHIIDTSGDRDEVSEDIFEITKELLPLKT